MTDELAYAGVAEIAARIRRRDLSPVEVLDAAIARIEERNPSLNALIYTAFDEARGAAKRAADEAVSGEPLRPLHGVPAAIKDLFDFKPGWPSTFGGIPALANQVIDARCLFAERIEDAGAILVGKTNSPVMGFSGTCDNALFGPTRNPFDVSRNSGGSSGGSAAAVADGLLPLAEGTDGGGSIRIPAAWCGVFGYQASFGRIPAVVRPNAFGSAMPFVYEGPITRSVEDAALALDVLSGYDARDPFAIDEQTNFTAALSRSMAGKRVAFSPDFGVFTVDSRIAEVVKRAAEAFSETGAHVEQIDFPLPYSLQELGDLWYRQIMLINVPTIESLKASGIDLRGADSEGVPERYLRWADDAYRRTLPELVEDYNKRTAVYEAMAKVFETYDVLLTPTVAGMPVRNAAERGDTVGPAQIEGVDVDPLLGGWCMTYFTNYAGHPAASVPAGMTDGLPVGMQIIGSRYGDADVLAASAAFERVRPWRSTYGQLASRPL